MENNENAGSVNVAGQTPDIATLCGSGGVVVEVGWARFPKSGKQAMAGSDDASFKAGDTLLVRTERGDIYARAMTDSTRKVHLSADFVKVVRVLQKEEADINLAKDLAREHESRKVFVEQVRKHGLDMHLSEVEITHGDSRIVFYFTAPGRVDFRALVRELAGALKSRIELRQIGVRDEARCTGGLGPCGLPLCCSSFLREFTTVTIRMAKVQGLVPNPQKVSGLCGRLMCCLAYEHGVYTDMMKDLPKAGSPITTPKGEGRVKEVMVMRNVIKVALGPGVVEEFTFEQLGCACPGCHCGADKDAGAEEESANEPAPARHSRRDSGAGTGPEAQKHARRPERRAAPASAGTGADSQPSPEAAAAADRLSVRRPKPRGRRPDRPATPKQ